MIMELKTEFVDNSNVTENDFGLILSSFGNNHDINRIKRYLRRRELGEPMEYILGRLIFRDLEFLVDKRVYITDPELTILVDEVIKAIFDTCTKPDPVVVECGVGCGSLSISLKKFYPDVRGIGLDLDPDALVVANKNIQKHNVDVLLIESDLFSDLPPEIVPDLIFADPPWGDEESLYDNDRDARYYHAMPCLSAYPVGGVISVHENILKEIKKRGWKSHVVLNMGVLEEKYIKKLSDMTAWFEVKKVKGISILHCKMNL